MHLALAPAFVTVVKYMRYVNMVCPSQVGVHFRSRGNEGIYAVFFRNGITINKANFIAVYWILFIGSIRIVYRLILRIPGCFSKQYRTDIGFSAYKEMISAIRP
jgi:hypothetical protein